MYDEQAYPIKVWLVHSLYSYDIESTNQFQIHNVYIFIFLHTYLLFSSFYALIVGKIGIFIFFTEPAVKVKYEFKLAVL